MKMTCKFRFELFNICNNFLGFEMTHPPFRVFFWKFILSPRGYPARHREEEEGLEMYTINYDLTGNVYYQLWFDRQICWYKTKKLATKCLKTTLQKVYERPGKKIPLKLKTESCTVVLVRTTASVSILIIISFLFCSVNCNSRKLVEVGRCSAEKAAHRQELFFLLNLLPPRKS